MTDCGRWVCFGPQRQGLSFDPRTRQKIDFTPTLGGWDLTMTLEPLERANKMLNKAVQEISAKKRDAILSGGLVSARKTGESHNLENNCCLDDTDDEDNVDELVASGGMIARPQPRKPSTQEVEAHMIDHYPFRSWCRYCVMVASRSDHHRRQNEVLVISRDYVFLQTAEMMMTDNSRKQKQQLLVLHPYS